MQLLTALEVHNNPNAPYIILAFIALTAVLYCVPTLYALFKNRNTQNILDTIEPKNDTVFVCHDEAFLHTKS